MTIFYKHVKWEQTLEKPHQQEHSNSLIVNRLCSILNCSTAREGSLWEGLSAVNCEHTAEGLHDLDACKSMRIVPKAKEVIQHYVPTAWLWLELLLCLTLQSLSQPLHTAYNSSRNCTQRSHVINTCRVRTLRSRPKVAKDIQLIFRKSGN